MYSALDIAKYVVDYCNDNDENITYFSLEILLYRLWLEYYNKTEKYLFDDYIFMDKFMPRIGEVSYRYHIFLHMEITHYCGRESHREDYADIDMDIVDGIIDKYAKMWKKDKFALTKRKKTLCRWWASAVDKGDVGAVPISSIID